MIVDTPKHTQMSKRPNVGLNDQVRDQIGMIAGVRRMCARAAFAVALTSIV